MTRVPIAALLVTAAACSSLSPAPEPRRGERPTVRFQVHGEAEATAVYRTIVQEFERRSGGDVELIELSEDEDHMAKLAADFAGGSPPDVFLINYREYAQFAAQGVLEPIGDHLDDIDLDLSRYYPQPVEAFTYDGVLQCMPQNLSSLVVYVNLDLFAAAGVPVPDARWTWSDFRRVALRMTGDGIHGIGLEPQVIRLAPFVWSNRGEIVDDPAMPSRFTLEEPAAREAVEFLVGLVKDDRVVPSEREQAAEDLETRFINGKLAMFLGSRRDTPFFREATALNWDVAPLPRGRSRAGILHSDAYCISKATDNLDDALALVRYAVGVDGQTIGAFSGRVVPALKTVASSPAFLDPARPPRHSRVFLDVVPFIRRTPVISTWPEIEDKADELVTRLFFDSDYSMDRFLRELGEETTRLFREGAP